MATGGQYERVLNATGIVLHTNLGRAPLPRAVAERLVEWSEAGCNVEFDLAAGERGERNRRLSRLLPLLTGCEAAIAVNNNAAALVLALATLAAGRAVILSRGEMVEIGGSFRIPEILEAAGCRLVEVGTTNKTHLEDFERAIDDETALLLRVHPSNYRVRGFTERVATPDLARLGERFGLPLIVDEGAGLLRGRSEPPFADHDSVEEELSAGAALVCSSADKVLGGPQGGLLMGQRSLVEACRRHPLYRAFRPGRLVYAVLEETLRRTLAGEASVVDQLWPDAEAHQARLQRLLQRLPEAEIVEVEGYVGAGAAPDVAVVADGLALPFREGWVEALRQARPPVIAYRRQGRILLDLRTVHPEHDIVLADAVLATRPR